MQFTQELSTANLVRRWEPGMIYVKDRILTSHVIMTAESIIEPWLVHDPTQLRLLDFAPAVELEPEVIILGTGLTLSFPAASLISELASQGIGVEVMDTAAACRTFNVLVHEARAVAAALLNEAPSPDRSPIRG